MAARAAQGQALRKYFFARYLESDEFKFPWDRAVLQRRARRRERAVRRRRHVNALQGAGRGNDSKSRSVVFRRRKEREQARAGDRRHSSDARPQCGEEPKLCCGPEMKAAKPGTPLRKLFGVDSEGNTAAALKLSLSISSARHLQRSSRHHLRPRLLNPTGIGHSASGRWSSWITCPLPR